MKSVYWSTLKRSFLSPLFLSAIVGTVLTCYISARDYIVDDMNVVYIIELMLNLGMMKKVLVFFAAIPFVTAFCQDYNSGYINFVLSRSSEKKYLISTVLSCVLSGFSAIFIGISIFGAILSVLYPVQTYETVGVYSSVAAQHPFLYLLILNSVFSLYAAVWTMAGLALSAILVDGMVALGSPLIWGYILEEMTDKLPSYLNLYKLSHCYDIFGQSVLLNYLYTIAVFIFVILIFGYIFAYFAKRRIRNEMV